MRWWTHTPSRSRDSPSPGQVQGARLCAYPVLQLRGELGLELAACAAAVVSLDEHLPGHRRLLRPHGEDRTRRSASSGKTRVRSPAWSRLSGPPALRSHPPPQDAQGLLLAVPLRSWLWLRASSYPSPGPAPPLILVRPWEHKPASSALRQLSHCLRRHLRPVAKVGSLLNLFCATHLRPAPPTVKRPVRGCALRRGALWLAKGSHSVGGGSPSGRKKLELLTQVSWSSGERCWGLRRRIPC